MPRFIVLTQEFTTKTYEIVANTIEEAEDIAIAGSVEPTDTEESGPITITSAVEISSDENLTLLNNQLLKVVEEFIENEGQEYNSSVISNVINKIAEQYQANYENYEVEFDGDSNVS